MNVNQFHDGETLRQQRNLTAPQKRTNAYTKEGVVVNNFIKDGKTYRIPRRQQIAQARKAGIDYKIAERDIPASALSQIQTEQDEEQLTLI